MPSVFRCSQLSFSVLSLVSLSYCISSNNSHAVHPLVPTHTLQAEPQCFSSDIADTRLARVADCFNAIRLFPAPEHRTIGAFRRTPKPDSSNPWDLPKRKSFDSCSIIVDLAFVTVEYSSWAAIMSELRRLLVLCSVGTFPDNKAGGVGHVGMDAKIRLFVGNLHGLNETPGGNTTDLDIASA